MSLGSQDQVGGAVFLAGQKVLVLKVPEARTEFKIVSNRPIVFVSVD